MSKIATKWIQDDAVTKEKLNADVAGPGLTQATGGELEINADGATLEVATDTLQIKALGVDTSHLAAQAVTAAKLGSDVAGDGLTGGAGADLDVQADTTGGANLATAINVSANGVAVKVDDATLEANGSSQLAVKADGIDATHIDETDDYTWTGSHDFSGGTGVSVPTPVNDSHAVTKAFLDTALQGMFPRGTAKALSTSNLTLSGNPGTVDGVSTWATGDKILLTNQSTGSENGVWEVDTTGAWSRPDNFLTGEHAAGARIWVNSGTNYGDTGWVCITDPPNDVIDTDALTFEQFTGTGQIDAGVGLTKDGNTIRVGDGTTGDLGGINRTANDIAVAVDNSTVEVDGVSEQVQVKDLGISTAKLAATSVTAAKLGSDVAGDGLTGGNGSDLDVQADATGGANLAKVINVSSNGVAVKVDTSTIDENLSGQLEVVDDGITAAKLNSDTAGEGIQQEAGGALALDINGLTNEETTPAGTDLLAIYDQTDGRVEKITYTNLIGSISTEQRYQEMHTITAGETTAGYFTLSNTPASARNVAAYPNNGKIQVNKQALDGTGVTPDFDILNSNQFHFKNVVATGLSEDFDTGDTVIVIYTY